MAHRSSGDFGPAPNALWDPWRSHARRARSYLCLDGVRPGKAAVAADSAAFHRHRGVGPLFSSATTIQPGEWTSIYGNNLGYRAHICGQGTSDFAGGTSVTIDGRPAYLYYASPGRSIYRLPTIPPRDRNGCGNHSQWNATSTVTLSQYGPSWSLLDGKHVAGIILRSDGSGAYGGGPTTSWDPPEPASVIKPWRRKRAIWSNSSVLVLDPPRRQFRRVTLLRFGSGHQSGDPSDKQCAGDAGLRRTVFGRALSDQCCCPGWTRDGRRLLQQLLAECRLCRAS